MLRIIVCVKAVPDPKAAEELKIDPLTKSLTRLDIPLVINSLDRNALETALLVKEQGEAQITVISMGPPAAGDVVKECLAIGADVGILLSDPLFAGADAFATAFTLAKGIEKAGIADVVLCGTASSDGATEWVGPELATFLKLSVVTMVREMTETQGQTWTVKADLENGYRLVRVILPALFTVTRDVNTPRSLSFSGIIKSRKKEITIWGIRDLPLTENQVGLAGSPTAVSNLTPMEGGRECELLAGTPEEKADLLICKLSEAGVI